MQLTDNYRIYLDYIILQLHGVWHLAVIGMLLIMQAISNPGSEDHQDRAWQSVVPLVSQLKQYYDFSISLGNLNVFVHCHKWWPARALGSTVPMIDVTNLWLRGISVHLSASDHVGMTNTLTLLIKMPTMVTGFRGHRRTLYFLPGIISLIITCIGIIMK